MVRSSSVRFDEEKDLSKETEDEPWEVNDYPYGIQIDGCDWEEENTTNQIETPLLSSESLTPFEQLSFNEHQIDEVIAQSENNAESNEQLTTEEIEGSTEVVKTRRGRPLGSKNKVYEKVNRLTRNTAAS